jgi:hypothetical protein
MKGLNISLYKPNTPIIPTPYVYDLMCFGIGWYVTRWDHPIPLPMRPLAEHDHRNI